MSEITVRVAKFVRLLDYLAALELDQHAAAREAGLSVAQLRAAAPDSTLSARQYARLYKTAVDQMQRLGQPVPWGAGVGSEAFALMCHCLISARTLGEALALAERFGRLLAAGMVATIFFYVAINLMMVMGLAPVVGIPLPFMSHGGSSMMTNMICIGTLMMVHRWNRRTTSSGFVS